MDTVDPAPRIVFIPGFMQPAGAWAPVAERLRESYPSTAPGEERSRNATGGAQPERYGRSAAGTAFRRAPHRRISGEHRTEESPASTAPLTLLDHRESTFEGRLREIEAAGEGAVLCGYSLGGRLALRAVLRDAERYAGLVTVSATAGIEAPAERARRAEADEKLASWIETQPIDRVVDVWQRQPLFADQSDALVEAQRPGRLRQDPRQLALILRTAGQGALAPVWQQLHGLTVPVLAISGSLDSRYTEAAMRIARAVPDGRAKIVEGAGHAPHLQRPDAVAGLLADFLHRHLGQRGV